MKLAIEHLSRPAAGQVENGDAVVVRTEGERTLVAVLDALGHGLEAAKASKAAVQHLLAIPLPPDLKVVIEGLHRALRGTRGAAAMLLLFEQPRLQSCGVGNVMLRSLGSRVPVLLRPGILGVRVKTAHVLDCTVGPGDRIIVFSDGLSPHLDEEEVRGIKADEGCRSLMERYGRTDDDATVLVVDVK